jgi:hypothetical protein
MGAECCLDAQENAAWIPESRLDPGGRRFGGWIPELVFPSAEGCFDSETRAHPCGRVLEGAGLIPKPCLAETRGWFCLPERGSPSPLDAFAHRPLHAFATACSAGSAARELCLSGKAPNNRIPLTIRKQRKQRYCKQTTIQCSWICSEAIHPGFRFRVADFRYIRITPHLT